MADLNSSKNESRKDEKPTDIKDSKEQRPRLGYFRSAWTTTDIFNLNLQMSDSSIETESTENVYQIRLPKIQLHDRDDEDDDEKDEILKEIFKMITVANVLCLTGSVVECLIVLYTIPSWSYLIQHYQEWIPHSILPFYTLWWLFMILVLRNRTEHLRQYLNWTQASAVVMASTNFMIPIRHSTLQQFHLLFVALSILASFIFAFAKRILYANELKTERLRSRLNQEITKIQDHVDKVTNDFSQHRLAFLSVVSQEIQDVALMVITTLEQFSPTSILSSNNELLSACSLAVPIASISAIKTTIKQVCHVNSHLSLLSKLTTQAWTGATTNLQRISEENLTEFDVGELLQNVGDAMAGVASKLDVKFVIYHCDNSIHHTLVLGDEGAIRHTLFNHLRNVLECCTPGACIEVGLNVVSLIDDPQHYKITFQITHTTSPAISQINAGSLPNANLTAQLLSYIQATSTADQDSANDSQTKFGFSFVLKRGQRDINHTLFLTTDSNLLKNHYANIKFANEPNLEDLTQFIETLKGLKMVLHAPEQSIFAKHLTSCLANWNADISHVPVDVSTPSSTTTANTSALPSPILGEEQHLATPPAFILIDDDILTLEAKLNEFRAQPPVSAQVLHTRRHHLKKASSPGTSNTNYFHHGATTIVHFTSLTHYKAVRDTIQCYALLPNPFNMPRVVVVPKPAGPRRFLTALHTAWHNSVVEPHFSAIATSPSSPLPPVISMMIQKERSPTNHELSPGRRNQRPSSGVLSPDNYFTSQPRRRSDHQQDYLTAKLTPLMNVLGVASTPAVMAAAMTAVQDEPVEKTEPAEKEPIQKTKNVAKSNTMTHFKLNKKKRKAKGTPFTDVVSPPINVLIVEDNIINQAILSTWMKKHKIKFSVASNGKEAVDKWKTGGFHLILMDIQLPVMNGIDATKTIRSVEKEQKIGVLPSTGFLRQDEVLPSLLSEDQPSIFRSPVIIVALTASSLESDRHAALAAGCNDFLTKPVSLEWLEKKIIEWGCMQALIDFEGWRRWKKRSQEDKTSSPTKHLEEEEKKKRIEELNVLMDHHQKKKGILLPGIKTRKLSQKKPALKPSKSDDTQRISQPYPQQKSNSDITSSLF